MRTLVKVEPGHPAYGLGYTQGHIVVYQPRDDAGGGSDCVAVNIPEASHQLPDAMRQARHYKARVLLICDTHEQAEDAARTVAELLPEHRRVSLDRAQAGGFAVQ